MTTFIGAARLIAGTRLLLGLLQGLALYALIRAVPAGSWPADRAVVFQPIYLSTLLIPLVFSFSLGHLRKGVLAIWVGIATFAVSGLAFYNIARNGTMLAPASLSRPLFGQIPDGATTYQLFFPLVSGLVIAQALVIAIGSERRLLPSYPRLFDASWNLCIQIILAFVFVGLFWSTLALGSALFGLVGLLGFGHFIAHSWFAVPATTLATAFAIQVTNTRTRLVEGARTLVLVLLAWLLPLFVGLATAFLVSLGFVSLSRLWSTHYAAHLLSFAAAFLILLVNAAYQDGRSSSTPPRILRLSGRLGALLLAPIVALAIVALDARVNQHGWSVDRVLSASFLLIAGLYALGYAAAAFRTGPWLGWLEKVNVACALATLAVIVALLTPLADPARLTANSQVARLRNGTESAEKFDYALLRFGTAGYGKAALANLESDPPGLDPATIRQMARAALNASAPGTIEHPEQTTQLATANDILGNVIVHPDGRMLPEQLLDLKTHPLSQPWLTPLCLKLRNVHCHAVYLDLKSDQTEQIAFVTPNDRVVPVLAPDVDGKWHVGATLNLPVDCHAERDALLAGKTKTVPTVWPDLELNGRHISLASTPNLVTCAKPSGSIN